MYAYARPRKYSPSYRFNLFFRVDLLARGGTPAGNPAPAGSLHLTLDVAFLRALTGLVSQRYTRGVALRYCVKEKGQRSLFV